jgi:16S rRNA (cytosine1402-N4)-methyltransferase
VEHAPVLVEQVVELLVPALRDGGVVLDGTIGRGGHAARILEAAPKATLIGIDRDPDAVAQSRANLAPYADRVQVVRADLASLASILERFGIQAVRGVILDLGVSSPQLDDPGRGFSFRKRGPLDMRMDPEQRLTAHEVVNEYSERDLATVIRRLGEERFAVRIARAIVAARPIDDTEELAEIVKQAIPAATRRSGGHPARRTFQALRMEVNDELRQLRAALDQALDAIEPGGRVIVLSYHSLEDRLVKKTFAEQTGGCTCPPDLPVCVCGAKAQIRVLTKRPVRPSSMEVARNRRASAAKLRAAERLGPYGGDAA